MNVEIHSQSFNYTDGSELEGKFEREAPVLMTDSHRLWQDMDNLLFAQCGFKISRFVVKGELPYVIALRPKRGNVSPADVRMARFIVQAYVQGVEHHYLYDFCG